MISSTKRKRRVTMSSSNPPHSPKEHNNENNKQGLGRPSFPLSSRQRNVSKANVNSNTSINLGSDAASSYYFSSTPQTPAVTKTLQKRQRVRLLQPIENTMDSLKELQQQEPSKDKSINDTKQASHESNNETTPPSSPTRYNLRSSTKKKRLPLQPSSSSSSINSSNDTTTNLTQELDAMLSQTNNEDDTASLLFSPTTTIHSSTNQSTTLSSIHHLSTTTTSSSPAISTTSTSTPSTLNTSTEDNLNKSVLSDTTELTASNFVLCASSKQAFLSFLEDEKKKKRKNDKSSKQAESDKVVVDETEVIQKNDKEQDVSLLDDSIQTKDLVTDSFESAHETLDVLSSPTFISSPTKKSSTKTQQRTDQVSSISSTPASLASSSSRVLDKSEEEASNNSSFDTMDIANLFGRDSSKKDLRIKDDKVNDDDTDEYADTMDIAKLLGRDNVMLSTKESLDDTITTSQCLDEDVDQQKDTRDVEKDDTSVEIARSNSSNIGTEHDDNQQVKNGDNELKDISQSSTQILGDQSAAQSPRLSISSTPDSSILHNKKDKSMDTMDIAELFGCTNNDENGEAILTRNDLGIDTSISIDNDRGVKELIGLDDSIQSNKKLHRDENPQNQSLLGTTSPTATVSTIHETKEQRKVSSSSSPTTSSLDSSLTVDDRTKPSPSMSNKNESVDTMDIAELFGRTVNNNAITDEKRNEGTVNEKTKMNGVMNLNDSIASFDASTILQPPREDVTTDFTLDLKDEGSISTHGMLYQSPFASSVARRKSCLLSKSGVGAGESPITMATGEFNLFSQQRTSSVRKLKANLQRTKQKLSRQKRKRMSSIGVVDSASSFAKRIPPSVARRKDEGLPLESEDDKKGCGPEIDDSQITDEGKECIEPMEGKAEKKLDESESTDSDTKQDSSKLCGAQEDSVDQHKGSPSPTAGGREVPKKSDLAKSPSRKLRVESRGKLFEGMLLVDSEEQSSHNDEVNDAVSSSSDNDSSLEHAEYTETFESIIASPLQKESDSNRISGFMLGRNKNKRRRSSIGGIESTIHNNTSPTQAMLRMQTVEELDSQVTSIDESKDGDISLPTKSEGMGTLMPMNESKDGDILSPTNSEEKIEKNSSQIGTLTSSTSSDSEEKDLEYSSSSISNVGTIVSSTGSLSSGDGGFCDNKQLSNDSSTISDHDRSKDIAERLGPVGASGIDIVESPVNSTVTLNQSTSGKDITWSSISTDEQDIEAVSFEKHHRNKNDEDTMDLMGMMGSDELGSNDAKSKVLASLHSSVRKTSMSNASIDQGDDSSSLCTNEEETIDTLKIIVEKDSSHTLSRHSTTTNTTKNESSLTDETDEINIDDIIVKVSRSSNGSDNSSFDDQLSNTTITTTNDDQSGGDRDETDDIASPSLKLGSDSRISRDQLNIDDIILKASRASTEPDSSPPDQNSTCDASTASSNQSILSLSHNHAEDDSDDDEDEIADTIAFRKLMRDLETRASSLTDEIQEATKNDHTNRSNSVSDIEMDKFSDSVASEVSKSTSPYKQQENDRAEEHAENDDNGTSPIQGSPHTGRNIADDLQPKTPKSILHSSRRRGRTNTSIMRSTSRRTVNFGSPVAAEYNIGSPPMSMTPMCSKRTKALFTIPQNSVASSKQSDNDDMTACSSEVSLGLDSVSSDEESTMQIGDESSMLNESFQHDPDNKTVEIERNMNHFIANMNEVSPNGSQLEINASEIQKQLFSGGESSEENSLSSFSSSSTGTSCASPKDSKNHLVSSHCQTPTQTIEMDANMDAVLAAIGEKDSTHKVHKSDTSEDMEVGDDTIHMEMDMKSVLVNVGNDNLDPTVPTPTQTIQMETDMNAVLTTIGEDSTHEVHMPKSSIDVDSDKHTMHMEMDMKSVLANLDNDLDTSGHTHSSHEKPVTTRFGHISDDDDSTTLSLDDQAEIVRMSEETNNSHQNCRKSFTQSECNITDDDLKLSITADETFENVKKQVQDDQFDESSIRSSLNLSKTKDVQGNHNEMSESWNVSLTDSIFMKSTRTSAGEFSDPTLEHFDPTQSTIGTWTDESSFTSNIVDMKWIEVKNAINPLPQTFNDSAGAVTGNLERLVNELPFPCASESILNFISDLCSEVERNAEEFDVDYDRYLSSQSETNTVAMSKVQKSLRGDYGEELMIKVKDMLNALQGDVQDEILRDFNDWECQVIGALSNSILGVSENVEKEEQEIDRYDSSINKTRKSVTKFSRRVAKKAQRKSIGRRMNTASEIEDEIAQLEESIRMAKEELSNKQKEQSEMEEIKRILAVKDSIQKELTTNIASAELKYQKFVSVEGFFPWIMTRNEENIMTIFYKNIRSKDLSLNVEFASNSISSASISCHVRIANDDISKMSKKQSYSIGVSYDMFYYYRVNNMIEKINTQTLSGTDIPTTIEYISWYLYRTEIIWNEFSQLLSRHKGRIKIDAQKGVFLHVQIGSNKEKNISVIFDIGFAYPFCLLDFELKGNVKITTLEKRIHQKLKPGFGYVSRICDVISSFLEGNQKGL